LWLLITPLTGEGLEDDVAPHTLAGAVSQFFRELPEPLLTHDLYLPFLQAAGMLLHQARTEMLAGIWTMLTLVSGLCSTLIARGDSRGYSHSCASITTTEL
jgi:hypothetical protein